MENSQKTIVFITDIDGSLTNGLMFYTVQGKTMKAFGCDDFDSIKQLSKKAEICLLTADKKGFDIVKKRAEEMEMPLFLVSNNAEERWSWIEEKYKNKVIVFCGDGINDYICLKKADLSFTVKDALPHIKVSAKKVIKRRGADRFIAECCIITDRSIRIRLLSEGILRMFDFERLKEKSKEKTLLRSRSSK